ncbi:uncharacterized protein LOC62_07G009175 [Vanrija pseudolonga]|uniref:UBA domain-containing protein n=1 Tax=Vanrija pseudolonga TaxID=143232 RepID=A0AAF0YJJ4_9TREE|nr:hypothetical protein LOC62_07G009175 [Vanrija pseudolonga]
MTQPPKESWWQKLRRGSAPPVDPASVNELVALGFPSDAVVAALKKRNGDLEMAKHQLYHDKGNHREPEDNPGCKYKAQQESADRLRKADQKAQEAERERAKMRNAVDYAKYQDNRGASAYLPPQDRYNRRKVVGIQSESEFAAAANSGLHRKYGS